MKATQSTFQVLRFPRQVQESRGNSTDLVGSLLNLYGLENSKPAVNPGRRSTMMELSSATLLDGHDYSNFRTTIEKLIFIAFWRPDMQFAIQQLSTQFLISTTESKRAVKQLIRHLEGTQLQNGLLEFVGRSDSDWASDSMTRQSVTGYHCDVQGVMMCSRSLRSCEAEFHAASACARELLGLAELFKELHYNVTVRLRNGFRRSETTLCSAEDQEDSMLGSATVDPSKAPISGQSGHEKQLSRSLHETSGWIANAVAHEETSTSNSG